MDSLFLPLRSLIDPVGGVPKAIEARRWVAGVFLAALLSAASGAAVALKVDSSASVIDKLSMAGELAKASEREISDAIEQAQRIWLVAGVAKGLLLMPLIALALAVVLKVAGWLISRKAPFGACLTAASLAMLPLAVFHAVELVATMRQVVLTPAMAEGLVPTSLLAFKAVEMPWARVLKAVDLVNVWSALVMGLGFASASKWSPWKGALFGLLLYVLFAAAFFVGLPGLMAGRPGMGGPTP